MALEKSECVARLIVDSRNVNVVYACALGREWGPSDKRGVFQTADGKSWQKVLYIDPQASRWGGPASLHE